MASGDWLGVVSPEIQNVIGPKRILLFKINKIYVFLTRVSGRWPVYRGSFRHISGGRRICTGGLLDAAAGGADPIRFGCHCAETTMPAEICCQMRSIAGAGNGVGSPAGKFCDPPKAPNRTMGRRRNRSFRSRPEPPESTTNASVIVGHRAELFRNASAES
ncbi:MAG: hypothetical protein QGH73_00850 [Rhodospirillales bacterium]|nr:hypothetical protein [Rhodospirillales bacterium]MDP6644479.1 hypothetical protein [Rhodospirillales bacterium]MDP6840206.1 hypothetical protein [Rhodospirillales bacterium]